MCAICCQLLWNIPCDIEMVSVVWTFWWIQDYKPNTFTFTFKSRICYCLKKFRINPWSWQKLRHVLSNALNLKWMSMNASWTLSNASVATMQTRIWRKALKEVPLANLSPFTFLNQRGNPFFQIFLEFSHSFQTIHKFDKENLRS